MENNIYCLIGASGSGKSSISNKLPFPKVVCYKSRKAREGEVEGIDSYFISERHFKEIESQMIATTHYAGNYYGITQGELFELETSPMIYVVDMNGYRELKEALKKIKGYENVKVVSIFLEVSAYELQVRMEKANRSKGEIDVRLGRLHLDEASKDSCDYIIKNENNQIEKTLWEISEIIMSTSWKLG